MQRVRDDWENTYDDLEKVLLFNRKLWNVFLASVMREDNPLPAAIRENIANIGVFVLSQLMDTMAHPHPSKLTSLININRELAAGLRGR